MDGWIQTLLKGVLMLGAGLLLAGEVLAGARIALVVGVNDYRGSRSVGQQGVMALPDLKLAVADAEAMATTLRGLGFTVDLLVDQPGARVTAERLVDAVEGFAGKLKAGRGEVALFYFAGHGVQGAPGSVADREGLWLLPGDADLTKGDVSARSARALAFTELELRFREAGSDRWTAPVIVLDACRNELPAAGSRSATRSRGLQMPQLSAGALVAFATAGGELAFEPDGATNGLYTSLLLEELGRPGKSLAEGFLNAQTRAAEHPRYRQQPELVIKGGRPQTVFLAGAAAAPITPTDPAAIELAFWQSTERVNTAEAYRAYLDRYPGGQFAALAGLKLRPVSPAPSPAALAPSPSPSPAVPVSAKTSDGLVLVPVGGALPGEGVPFRHALQSGGEGPEMVVLPSGRFRMGSKYGNHDKKPVREVTIGSFALGVTELTFKDWDLCVSRGGCGGYQPEDWGWGRGDRPMMNVSWSDAQAYVEWLRGETGGKYRLPSESEWEYGARAGTGTAYWWGNQIGRNRANCSDCGDMFEYTSPVKSFSPNSWGLYDTSGNVWEWVQDCYVDSYAGAPVNGSFVERSNCRSRVLRGASWDNAPAWLRSADRGWNAPAYRGNNVGFRLALDR